VLSLDRPFTYELDEGLAAGIGSLVQVPFHGRLVRGWVLGPTEDVPERLLQVKKAVSPVRFFDPSMLEVLRWVSERYVAPLASVIARSHPPRVASEETIASAPHRTSGPVLAPDAVPILPAYRAGPEMLAALHGGAGAFVVRPAPEDEQRVAMEAVGAALAGGRSAIVLVPELEPLPATASAILEAYGERAALFAGGSRRARYRMWLDIEAGAYPIVVGTRPAVFAPTVNIGLLYVSRESHAGHREERSPYYHVRDVALARARHSGAVCAMAALSPSGEAVTSGAVDVTPRVRQWPPVEVVRPGPEGRAPRLVSALKEVDRGFLFQPLPGYGVARVCRACGEPAACAACGGVLRSQGGAVRCAVCGANGTCANCGAADFGIARGGAERVEEWARAVARVPVHRTGSEDHPGSPGAHEVSVGGVEAVKEFGSLDLDLVAILDADQAGRRPGLAAREQALATWMEVAAWARPSGRVIVQTRHPGDPAVQSLVSGNPDRFHRSELPRRADAGFPAGWPVFRVSGDDRLPEELAALEPRTLLSSSGEGRTVCLVVLDPGVIRTFGRTMRALAEGGVVTRVEAEPHL
jgi:primosomal protein N' (replication factor Y) (superfamily II helicase)